MPGRDLKLTIGRLTETGPRRMNEPQIGFVASGQVWAEKYDLTDQEKMAAGQQVSARVCKFVMRSNEKTRALSSDDQLQHLVSGRVWDIKGKLDGADGRDRSVIVMAVERSDDG